MIRRSWAVFISGRGSNLQAQLDCLASADVRTVVSSAANAPGLLRARRQGISILVLPKKIDWIALDAELRRRRITHVFLAGFMKLIPESFVERWENKILNVHPSLLPAYPGLHSLDLSYEAAGDMGVTVHVVTPDMDAGPKIYQRRSVRGPRPEWMTPLEAQFRISRDEQRLVREGLLKWR